MERSSCEFKGNEEGDRAAYDEGSKSSVPEKTERPGPTGGSACAFRAAKRLSIAKDL